MNRSESLARHGILLVKTPLSPHLKMKIPRFFADIKRGNYICGDAQSLCIFGGNKTEIHGDPRTLLRTPSRQVKQFGFGAKKDKYTSNFFALYYYLF